MDSDDFDAIQQADVAKSAVVFRKFIEKVYRRKVNQSPPPQTLAFSLRSTPTPSI